MNSEIAYWIQQLVYSFFPEKLGLKIYAFLTLMRTNLIPNYYSCVNGLLISMYRYFPVAQTRPKTPRLCKTVSRQSEQYT